MKLTDPANGGIKLKCKKKKKKNAWRANNKERKKGGQGSSPNCPKADPRQGSRDRSRGRAEFSSFLFILGYFIKAWTALAGPADVGQAT